MKFKHFLAFAILCFGLAIISISITGRVKSEKNAARQAQKVFAKKEVLVKNAFNKIRQDYTEREQLLQGDLKNKDVSIFLIEQDSLVFWSDNSLTLDLENLDSIHTNNIVDLQHKTYCCITDTVHGNLAVGMIQLANNFPYQNRFLRNGIISEYKQTKGAKVSTVETGNSYPVLFSSGELAFYLDYSNLGLNEHFGLRIIGTIFFFMGVFFLLNLFRLLVKELSAKSAGKISFMIIIFLLSVRVVLILTNVLANQFLLFDPYIYATKIAPSYGDLILNSILFLFFAYLIKRFISLPAKWVEYAFNRNAWVGILNLVFILSVIYVHYISASLISHSSLDIVVHNISQLRFPVIIAYAILAMNYLAIVLVALWVFKNLEKVSLYKLYINCGVMLSITLLASVLVKQPISVYTIVFCFLLYIVAGYLKDKIQQRTILSSMVYFLLFFSVYIMVYLVDLSEKKDIMRNKSLAISLSSEHDPIAEYLFKDISKELKQDEFIKEKLAPENFDIIELSSYIQKNYFNAYWKKYDLGLTVCRPQDSVLVDGNDLYWYPCYPFFEEAISNNGIRIPSSRFYYIDKLTGLINYLGWIKYDVDGVNEISVFIELDSKLTTKPLGYPELLLDEGLQNQEDYSENSYAKYYKGNLVSHSGRYEYSLISKVFEENSGQTFSTIKHNGFEHLVYQPNEDNLIIISKPIEMFIDYLVLFSYVFVFYYLIALLIAFLLVSQYRHINFRDSLRNRIQFSVISILLVSLLLIAGSTTWFNIRKYNQTQSRIIEEKINSVYVELEHKLAYEESLSNDWHSDKYDNLNQLLIKFSDVFYSDINVYSPAGNLLATSRNEVFQLGLQSKKMEPLAFHKMNNERLARFVNREKINDLAYLSAYVPFVNIDGKVLAYLNLPYFTKQKELQEDITTITVAIINIYVLLILLTIIIAVVISDQITKPLEMIQDRFRELKLGGKYEPIRYSRNDEIGRLVVEYNSMVLELERNIELLAKSERESAWREMAKQVAHEIKNPLTPMRLSVQQLKRSWDDKKENFESYLNRVTITLIEQIDNLSRIASEFSNFAKMPVAEIGEVNLYEVLKASTALFKANERVAVSLNAKNTNALVLADTDQLGRVFINIIKNGIQAIPESKKGKVDILLKVEKEMAIVEISDNGKGIPEDIHSKLFAPNFTTKSSGMGLGLAIVKNILDSVDGTITLSTELNKGSRFIVTFPLLSGE